MGEADDALKDFIDGIPDDKLTGISNHTLHSDQNYRLDNQGLTSGDPQYYNLQVQVNSSPRIKSLKSSKKRGSRTGTTVAKLLVPVKDTWSAKEIREKLGKAIMI